MDLSLLLSLGNLMLATPYCVFYTIRNQITAQKMQFSIKDFFIDTTCYVHTAASCITLNN